MHMSLNVLKKYIFLTYSGFIVTENTAKMLKKLSWYVSRYDIMIGKLKAPFFCDCPNKSLKQAAK